MHYVTAEESYGFHWKELWMLKGEDYREKFSHQFEKYTLYPKQIHFIICTPELNILLSEIQIIMGFANRMKIPSEANISAMFEEEQNFRQ